MFQETFLRSFGLVRRNSPKNTSPKKTTTSAQKESRGKMCLSKRTQFKIVEKVPITSDLGLDCLQKVKPFVYTDYHREKIERHVNKENKDNISRRSDVPVSFSYFLS